MPSNSEWSALGLMCVLINLLGLIAHPLGEFFLLTVQKQGVMAGKNLRDIARARGHRGLIVGGQVLGDLRPGGSALLK
jgi:hypothetical protein